MLLESPSPVDFTSQPRQGIQWLVAILGGVCEQLPITGEKEACVHVGSRPKVLCLAGRPIYDRADVDVSYVGAIVGSTVPIPEIPAQESLWEIEKPSNEANH